MHLRNNRTLSLLLALFIFNIATGAQQPAAPSQAPPPPNSQSPAPGQQSAPNSQPPTPAQPSTPDNQAPQAPPANGQETPGASPDQGSEGGGFVFKAEVQEVVLHATVVDDKQRMITTLDKNAFTVFEDGKQQNITSFRHEDIPIALGIFI